MKNRKGSGGMGRGPMMSMPVQKAKNFKGTSKRLLGYLKPSALKIIIVVIFAIASTILSVISPKIMGKITTELYKGFIMKLNNVPGASINFDKIGDIILILISIYILSSIFNFVMQFMMAKVSQVTVYNMSQEVNEKLERLPLKYFDSNSKGDILSRITNDIDNISNTLRQNITQLITAVVTIVGIIVMMLSISPIMTLITLITLPLSVFITKNIAKKSQIHFKGQQDIMGELNAHVEEMYTGHVVVKSFNYEDESISTFKSINEKLYTAGWKAQFISGIIMPLMNFVNNLGYVLVCIVGGIMASKGMIEVGNIQAFIQYSRRFGQPIVQTATIANTIQSTIASAERIFEILDEEEEKPDAVNAYDLDNPKGDVLFKNVKFGYKEDEILIKDMNIDVKAGELIAIVGPTGAGKTTLVNLLMRFYELNGGEISIDGRNITSLNRSNLRKMFGMVLQDTWLFKGSIMDNIAYGKSGATEEEVINAAKIAHADFFIRTLPNGYDTIINEEATNISQGQKQLITIARAILADPKMLILDEATSSVDTRTEVYIQNAMNALMKDRTSFVIAHRLSTIQDADVILVMNDGDIIEKGNHKELIEMDGFYADLYNSQFVGA